MQHIAFLSSVIWLLSFSSAAAQTDTLVINHPQKVTVISNDSLQKVLVNGKQGDDDYVYQNTIRLVDANYESKTSISRDHWDLIPSVKLGKKSGEDDSNSHYSNQLTMHFGLGFTAPTKVD